MALVPHECALVKQREGKPFVLLGVNGDKDVAHAKKVATAKGITWRSFKDQRDGEGTISKAWNLRGWPTLYLIDHKGIIRQRWVGAPPSEVLDREVDRLIAAAETEKKNKGVGTRIRGNDNPERTDAVDRAGITALRVPRSIQPARQLILVLN
jgi:hypothetical protein